MSLRKLLVFKWAFHHIFNKKVHLQPHCINFIIFLPNQMKAVCYILAIIIAGLSTYPCNDADICVDDEKFSYSILEVDNHDHSSAEVDLCTPFCACSCCSAHIQLPATFIFNVKDVPSSSPFNFYSSVFADRFSYSIWQPPKLA